MKNVKYCARLIFAGGLALASFSVTAGAQSREMPRAAGVPISSRLVPGEASVVVKETADAPLVVLPDKKLLTWMTRLVEAIAIIEVTDALSEVTLAEDWVTTKLSVLVTSVLKSPAGSVLQPGATMIFRQDGGSTSIAGTTVTARVPWVPLLIPGRTYLAFFDVEGSGEQQFESEWVFEIDAGGVVHRLSTEPLVAFPDEDDVSGRLAADVVARTKQLLSMR